jgi:AraC-like DNA-binding protein
MLLTLAARAQVTIIIESLPTATPTLDTIFIAGTFNNWTPNDKAFMLTRLLNGQMGITLPVGIGQHEYKFTRGSWTKVETTRDNQYTQNRILPPDASATIRITIDNWLDMGGAQLPGYSMLYFFACAFQGLAILLLVFRIQKRDVGKVRIFVIVNTTLVLLFSLLVLQQIVNPIWQSYITFVFQVAFYTWGPLLLYYISTFQYGTLPVNWRYYLIPAAVSAIFVLLRLLNFSAFQSLSSLAWAHLTWASALLLVTGFVFTIWIHGRLFRQIPSWKKHESHSPKSSFLYYFYTLSALTLLFFLINLLVVSLGFRHSFLDDFLIIGFSASTLIFLQTYYLWRHPEIMKEEKAAPVIAEVAPIDWIEKLNHVMREQKPYKNPELSVSDLAEIMNIKAHVLSRGINDHFHRNFRDFVNGFRIEEFIALAEKKEYKHYTFLALAQEVGFNSKSTFNLAFKKATDMSPREYFKHRADEPEYT